MVLVTVASCTKTLAAPLFKTCCCRSHSHLASGKAVFGSNFFFGGDTFLGPRVEPPLVFLPGVRLLRGFPERCLLACCPQRKKKLHFVYISLLSYQHSVLILLNQPSSPNPARLKQINQQPASPSPSLTRWAISRVWATLCWMTRQLASLQGVCGNYLSFFTVMKKEN